MSRSWNPMTGAFLERRRRSIRVGGMLAAILLLAITSGVVVAVLHDRQAVRVGVPTTVHEPYADNGMTLELRSFEIVDEVPGDEPDETQRAPQGTRIVIVTVAQRIVDDAVLGTCTLALGREEQRWTQPLDILNPIADLDIPDLPEDTDCVSSFAEPPPESGQEHVFGAAYLVPADLVDEELRPVVTVQDADHQARPDEVWL